jgi:hypothetical protein
MGLSSSPPTNQPKPAMLAPPLGLYQLEAFVALLNIPVLIQGALTFDF